MKTINKKIGYWKWADRRCKKTSNVCRAYVFEIIFSKNRVFATAKTTRSSFWGAPPMFLNHFLTSTEQGSWTKSCVLQGIVLWTLKTTSEKHERARSLHRRRHHVHDWPIDHGFSTCTLLTKLMQPSWSLVSGNMVLWLMPLMPPADRFVLLNQLNCSITAERPKIVEVSWNGGTPQIIHLDFLRSVHCWGSSF